MFTKRTRENPRLCVYEVFSGVQFVYGTYYFKKKHRTTEREKKWIKKEIFSRKKCSFQMKKIRIKERVKNKDQFAKK